MLKKRLVAITLTLIAVLNLSPAVAAVTAVCLSPTETVISLSLDPRFSYMSRIASSLSVNSLGRASCTGTFTTYDEYDSTITMTLQQFKDGKWSSIKEWSEDYSGSGIKALDKGYYVASGYRYRVVTVVQIWGTDGKELEKASCDSPIYEY